MQAGPDEKLQNDFWQISVWREKRDQLHTKLLIFFTLSKKNEANIYFNIMTLQFTLELDPTQHADMDRKECCFALRLLDFHF